MTKTCDTLSLRKQVLEKFQVIRALLNPPPCLSVSIYCPSQMPKTKINTASPRPLLIEAVDPQSALTARTIAQRQTGEPASRQYP